MTGEEDSEVLSRNLSSTTNSNISLNNQNPTASSTSSVVGILSKRDEKVDEQEDKHNTDSNLIKSHGEIVKHSNHLDLDSETRIKNEDDTEGFGSVDDFEEDDDEDAMQIDLSRTAESPDDIQNVGKDSLNFSGGEQDASAICTSTSGSGHANLLVEPVNSTTNIGSSLRSPLLPLPSHSGVLGACSSAVGGGRTPGQISRSDSQSQDLNDDPDILILTSDELVALPQDKFSHVYGQLGESYRNLHCRLQDSLDEIAQLKETVQRTQLQISESARRENLLVMRLTTKEQEMQEYVVQVNELKSAVVPTSSSLRSTLLDPAVNLIILKMRKELEETKKKLEDTQNDLNAWKFTPDSNTGKRLMAKCRMLYQENEELGKMISSGRLAKLESDLALQKSLTDEMKKSQSELDELVQELDEDVEGMQSTVCFLQQQLRDIKQSANPSSNPHNSVSEAELVNVNVTELCAQCRAIQEKKKQQEEQSQNLENSNALLPHSQIKLDNTSPDSSPSSSCEPLVTQTRTWVNGEVDGLMENDRKPLNINSKPNHLMSKLESSKSNFYHDDALTNDVNVGSDNNAVSTGCSVANFVQKNQSVNIKKEKEEDGELSSVRQKRKLPSRGGSDLTTYEPETVTPIMKRTKRTYSTSLHNSSPLTGSSSINSSVVNSSVSLRNSIVEPATFPSSSSFVNSPTTANGNGSLEH